jgi:hypothetical protein
VHAVLAVYAELRYGHDEGQAPQTIHRLSGPAAAIRWGRAPPGMITNRHLDVPGQARARPPLRRPVGPYTRFISNSASPSSREISHVTLHNPYPRRTRMWVVAQQDSAF